MLQDGLISRQAGVRALAALLPPTAADEWNDGAPALIGEGLLGEFTAAFTPLASWSVEEWFGMAFAHAASAEQQSPDSDLAARQALAQWLDQLAEAATLLWPAATGQSPRSATQADRWLYWPEQPAATLGLEQWPPIGEAPDTLQDWLAHHPTVQLHRGPIQEVLIVQRLGLADL